MNKRLKKNLRKPQKKAGVISAWNFTRAGIVMSAYDEARENGEKHSVAVKQTVAVVRQRHPKIRISETGVRRILAKFRPRQSHTILRFERSPLSGADLALHYWILDQQAIRAREQGVKFSAPSNVSPRKSVTRYLISFGERPDYPRFNRKLPKE
jgi:hypothetical protein